MIVNALREDEKIFIAENIRADVRNGSSGFRITTKPQSVIDTEIQTILPNNLVSREPDSNIFSGILDAIGDVLLQDRDVITGQVKTQTVAAAGTPLLTNKLILPIAAAAVLYLIFK